MAKLNRNDPCHCGSGKKYKQCHLREDETRAGEEKNLRTVEHWVTFYARQMRDLAKAAAGESLSMQTAVETFYDGVEPPETPLDDPTFADYLYYDRAVGDAAPIAAVEADGDDRVALRDALEKSYLSLYEVTDVRRGRWVKLSDRLSGRNVTVASAEAADALDPMEVVLGRVIEARGRTVFLDGWRKVVFRRRKHMIRALVDQMPEVAEAEEVEESEESEESEAAEEKIDKTATRREWLASRAPLVAGTVRSIEAAYAAQVAAPAPVAAT